MASLNKVLLMGNLTRDPQISHLPSGTPAAEFGLAMTRKFKRQDGSPGEETCFVDCRMYGKRAETIGRYFKKGEPIFIEGRLQLDQWEDKKDGTKRSRLRVFVENFEFVGGGRRGGEMTDGAAAPARSAAPRPAADVPPAPGGGDDFDAPSGGGDADDLPPF